MTDFEKLEAAIGETVDKLYECREELYLVAQKIDRIRQDLPETLDELEWGIISNSLHTLYSMFKLKELHELSDDD